MCSLQGREPHNLTKPPETTTSKGQKKEVKAHFGLHSFVPRLLPVLHGEPGYKARFTNV